MGIKSFCTEFSEVLNPCHGWLCKIVPGHLSAIAGNIPGFHNNNLLLNIVITLKCYYYIIILIPVVKNNTNFAWQGLIPGLQWSQAVALTLTLWRHFQGMLFLTAKKKCLDLF